MRNLFLFCFSLLFLSCVEELPVVPDDVKSEVVVTCLLTNSDTQELTLTRSKSIHSGLFFDEVEDAEINLYQDDVHVGKFSKGSYSKWNLPYRPIPGKKYRLQIDIAGESPIVATTIMPTPSVIKRKNSKDKGSTKMFVQKTSSSVSWIFALSTNLSSEQYAVSPPSITQNQGLKIMQRIGTNHKSVDRFNQEGSSVDFDPDFGNTLSYKHYLRIMLDESINESTPYSFGIQYGRHDASFVVIRHASDDYDRYLKSIKEKKTFHESDTDPVRWFDESVIYGNINNGLGIFGAYFQEYYYYNFIIDTL